MKVFRKLEKFIALFVVASMLVLTVGCDDDEYYEYLDGYDDEYDDKYDDDEYGDEDDFEYEEDTSSAGQGGASVLKGVVLSVNESDGKMNITREKSSVTDTDEDDDIWTIFVYLCGTDLESEYESGTGDFDEMLASVKSDNVRFVVQTGGTNEWNMDGIDTDKFQRFVVQNGDIQLVDEQPLAGMGLADSFKDFLIWGSENYDSEHTGVVLWNHGGGSITGVCFDEVYDYDSLDLTELDNAFLENLQKTGQRYDFVGFDACLMGTIEMANILATYADYMYGSEEMEPGSGWNYTAIGDYLAKNPDATGAELGKEVCDSYLQASIDVGDGDMATLSVIDLSKIDDLVVSFNTLAKNMYAAGEDANIKGAMIRGITAVDNYGGNNKSEGYTNMVDLGGIIDSVADYADGGDEVKKALENAVIYSVSGSDHAGCSGLSMYYPLCIQGSHELQMFGKICVSPYYLTFVDDQGQGAVSGGSEPSGDEDEDNDSWFDEDGDWNSADSVDDDYWSFLDNYETSGESSYITFAEEPNLNDEGTFGFKLDDNGIDNASSVSALVYQATDNENEYIELGETLDVQGDWSTGEFTDYFDGYWLSLPDGQNLAIYPVIFEDDYMIYTSPISLNGQETNLRIRVNYDDGSTVIEGAWDGIDEYGSASRDIYKLENGDKIVPLYYAVYEDSEEETLYEGEEYVVSGKLEVSYDYMYSGSYYYAFCIDDIYGDYYVTDMVVFDIDEDGNISFEE